MSGSSAGRTRRRVNAPPGIGAAVEGTTRAGATEAAAATAVVSQS